MAMHIIIVNVFFSPRPPSLAPVLPFHKISSCIIITGEECVNTMDVEKHFRDSGRFQEGKENRALFQVKERAIQALELIFNSQFYICLQVYARGLYSLTPLKPIFPFSELISFNYH